MEARGRLVGRHALLTGAGGGIGLAVTAAFLAEGAHCTAVDLAAEPGDRHCCADRAPWRPARTTSPPTSRSIARDRRSCRRRRAALRHDRPALQQRRGIRHGPAARIATKPCTTGCSPSTSRACSSSCRRCSRRWSRAAPSAAASSTSRRRPGGAARRWSSHYCATKAAVISYTQSAALAMAPHGIRVNAIAPGVIDTPMWQQRRRVVRPLRAPSAG